MEIKSPEASKTSQADSEMKIDTPKDTDGGTIETPKPSQPEVDVKIDSSETSSDKTIKTPEKSKIDVDVEIKETDETVGKLADVGGSKGVRKKNSSDDALYARGSFRKKAVAKAEADAPRDSDGNMICPTCGKVIPKSITKDTKNGPMTRRGYDLDHYPLTWDERKKNMKASGIKYTRKQVLDEYNSDLRVQCPPCNQGHLYEGVEGEFANGKK